MIKSFLLAGELAASLRTISGSRNKTFGEVKHSKVQTLFLLAGALSALSSVIY
jgi:hypothetical protein